MHFDNLSQRATFYYIYCLGDNVFFCAGSLLFPHSPVPWGGGDVEIGISPPPLLNDVALAMIWKMCVRVDKMARGGVIKKATVGDVVTHQ